MKDLNTISSDLFNKIRSRFSNIKLGDEQGALTDKEDEARFFDVTYKVRGKDLGRINIKLDDDVLTVIYNTDLLADSPDAKSDWFKFLKELRQFARSNLLKFDIRDITKSNLDRRDYEYLSKESGESKMSESRLFGTSKTSYQEVGEAKIIVKHSAPVNYNNPAGRTQRIESIYIESSSGERFRYPSKHLNGARAMAVHVANGGAPYDAMGGYIAGLSEEIGKLRQFKNYTQRSGVVAEALGPISEQVAERLAQLKLEVSALQRQQYYESFRENFQPHDAIEVPEETMSEWVDALTIKTFNEELTSVFPYIYRLVKEKADQGLTYDDIVAEAATCETCNEDPCACDDEEVKETNHLADFEQYLEDLTTFDYDVVESDSAKTKMIFSGNYYFMGKHAENVFMRNDLELVNVSQDDDSNTVEYTVVGSPEDLSFAQSEFESMDDAEGSYGGAYSESDKPDSEDDVPFDGPYTKNQGDVTDKSGAVHTGHSRAKHLAKQAIPEEIVEFIHSMYDSISGTFPRGEEGVKIACEKKFGESAGRFAQFAVERLSSNMGEGAPIALTPGSTDPGGAVDNFKQQMANNTEIKFQRQQQGIKEGSCNMTEEGKMCEVHGMEDCSMKETTVNPELVRIKELMKY